MKKFISAILIISILGSSTSITEVVKVPALIRHYYQHESINSQTDFSNFLTTHYLKIAKMESVKDLEQHAQLPFKSRFNYNMQLQAILFDDVSFNGDLKINRNLFFEYIALMEQYFLQKIWQPPV